MGGFEFDRHGPAAGKQVPGARKKALGMTKFLPDANFVK
jgi:hypothetical protein